MAELKILVEGYARAREEENFELAYPTTALIKNNNLNIIVDPGMNRKLLLESLEKENLPAKDVNYVILTHLHLDHSLLTGIFENAEILYAGYIFSFDGKIQEQKQGILGQDIEIIKTPGHSSDCITVLVKTDKGNIAVSSDVFWWTDGEEQKTDKQSLMDHEDPYATDIQALKQSRKKVLEIADYIIPGHGKMFEVKK